MYERVRNGCVVFGVPWTLSAKQRPVGGYIGIYGGNYMGGEKSLHKAKANFHSGKGEGKKMMHGK